MKQLIVLALLLSLVIGAQAQESENSAGATNFVQGVEGKAVSAASSTVQVPMLIKSCTVKANWFAASRPTFSITSTWLSATNPNGSHTISWAVADPDNGWSFSGSNAWRTGSKLSLTVSWWVWWGPFQYNPCMDVSCSI